MKFEELLDVPEEMTRGEARAFLREHDDDPDYNKDISILMENFPELAEERIEPVPSRAVIEKQLLRCEQMLQNPRLPRYAVSLWESRRNALAWVLGREMLTGAG